MTQQEQFKSDYLAAFRFVSAEHFDQMRTDENAGIKLTQRLWLQQAKRHEAEIAELVGVCKQALYALKGREHDQFLRDAIAKYEAKK